MQVELLYGRGTIAVTLPPGCEATVLEKPSMPVVADPRRAVADALAKPVAAPPLAESAKGAKRACILICDITRPVPNGLFLRPLIEELITAGIEADQISLLVATGLHRPNEDAELAEIIGDPWVQATVRAENHFARDDAAHVLIGETPRGTVVKLDRRFVEADVRIATGLVEPHFMAGYSGGRKVIAPGIAHADTITTFHNHRFMSHPNAANCVLDGNPLHEEQLAIVEMLGGGQVLALNTVIDDQRRLAFVNFGDLVDSHMAAVAFVREYAEVDAGRRFKTVLTSAAGYPLDKTYYQTVKGMVGAMGIVEPDGELIIASECSEGLGSDEYKAAQAELVANGPDGFLRSISGKSHAAIDEWQTQMQTQLETRALAEGRVSLYAPALDATDRALTGVHNVDSLEQALAASVERHGPHPIAVIPEGPYVIPFA